LGAVSGIPARHTWIFSNIFKAGNRNSKVWFGFIYFFFGNFWDGCIESGPTLNSPFHLQHLRLNLDRFSRLHPPGNNFEKIQKQYKSKFIQKPTGNNSNNNNHNINS